MLGNNDASANLAVKDLDRARKFYEGTLGLKQVESMDDELIVYRSGEDENGEMGFDRRSRPGPARHIRPDADLDHSRFNAGRARRRLVPEAGVWELRKRWADPRLGVSTN